MKKKIAILLLTMAVLAEGGKMNSYAYMLIDFWECRICSEYTKVKHTWERQNTPKEPLGWKNFINSYSPSGTTGRSRNSWSVWDSRCNPDQCYKEKQLPILLYSYKLGNGS